MEDNAIEHPRYSLGNTVLSTSRAAECAAVTVGNDKKADELREVVHSWDSLPAQLKIAVLAIIRSASHDTRYSGDNEGDMANNPPPLGRNTPPARRREGEAVTV